MAAWQRGVVADTAVAALSGEVVDALGGTAVAQHDTDVLSRLDDLAGDVCAQETAGADDRFSCRS